MQNPEASPGQSVLRVWRNSGESDGRSAGVQLCTMHPATAILAEADKGGENGWLQPVNIRTGWATPMPAVHPFSSVVYRLYRKSRNQNRANCFTARHRVLSQVLENGVVFTIAMLAANPVRQYSHKFLRLCFRNWELLQTYRIQIYIKWQFPK